MALFPKTFLPSKIRERVAIELFRLADTKEIKQGTTVRIIDTFCIRYVGKQVGSQSAPLLYAANLIFTAYSVHINLRPYSARNAQQLGQIDVSTVSILFDRPTRLPVAGT